MFKTYSLYIFLFLSALSFLRASLNKNIECSICDRSIKDKEYLLDVWGNPFHLSHKNDGIFCECCSRIISKKITNGGYQLNDGRYICSLCDISIIKTKEEVTNSFNNVKKILNEIGVDLIHEEEIDIQLINRTDMGNYYNFNENHHLQGLTKISLDNDKIFQIFILDNVPKIQFEATLAHELMHVWLYKKNIQLSKPMMEAFCNLGSYLIYKSDNTKFSKIHILSMENKNTNPYVKEYKLLKSLMDKTNFKHILKNITTINIQ